MVNGKNIISGNKTRTSSKFGSASSAHGLASDQLKDMNYKRMFTRPLIGAVLSLGYGYYFDNRYFANSRELMRAGVIGGSILAADIGGNMLFPHLMLAKTQNYREIENMVIEPLMTGLFYTAGKYYFIDGRMDELADDFVKGAVIDLASGAGEFVVGAIM